MEEGDYIACHSIDMPELLGLEVHHRLEAEAHSVKEVLVFTLSHSPSYVRLLGAAVNDHICSLLPGSGYSCNPGVVISSSYWNDSHLHFVLEAGFHYSVHHFVDGTVSPCSHNHRKSILSSASGQLLSVPYITGVCNCASPPPGDEVI